MYMYIDRALCKTSLTTFMFGSHAQEVKLWKKIPSSSPPDSLQAHSFSCATDMCDLKCGITKTKQVPITASYYYRLTLTTMTCRKKIKNYQEIRNIFFFYQGVETQNNGNVGEIEMLCQWEHECLYKSIESWRKFIYSICLKIGIERKSACLLWFITR